MSCFTFSGSFLCFGILLIGIKHCIIMLMYVTIQDLHSEVKKQDLVLGLTQENLMEFLDTSCLSYIHLAASSYYTNLAYPKETCVLYAINM